MALESLMLQGNKSLRIEEIPQDETCLSESEMLIPVAHFHQVSEASLSSGSPLTLMFYDVAPAWVDYFHSIESNINAGWRIDFLIKIIKHNLIKGIDLDVLDLVMHGVWLKIVWVIPSFKRSNNSWSYSIDSRQLIQGFWMRWMQIWTLLIANSSIWGKLYYFTTDHCKFSIWVFNLHQSLKCFIYSATFAEELIFA